MGGEKKLWQPSCQNCRGGERKNLRGIVAMKLPKMKEKKFVAMELPKIGEVN